MDLSQLTPDTAGAVRALVRYAGEQRIPVSLASAYRTCDQQYALYAQGRSVPGKLVTGAPGCFSWHTHGRAVDLAIPGYPIPLYEKLGLWWEKLGGVWGGRFQDPNHFEWHPRTKVAEACPRGPGTCPTLAEITAMPLRTKIAMAFGGAAIVVGGYLWLTRR